MRYQGYDKTKLRQQHTEEAVSLAMQGRWEEAASINRAIVELFPTDADAYNRLGRAFMELGRYGEARDAYSHSLELNPNNVIARKNLDRLSVLGDEHPSSKGDSHKVPLHLFVGEAGKVGMVNLCRLPPREILAKMSTGNEVYLKVKEGKLVIESEDGEYLGQVDPRHSLRLIRLIEGGNEYATAIANLNEGEINVVIRETFQHPSQAGQHSFPSRRLEGFRAYARESLLKYELEDEPAESYPNEESEALVDDIDTIAVDDEPVDDLTDDK